MRHNIVEDGYAFRLRPVTLDDAQFIVDLRTDPERNQYIHATSRDPGTQRAWIEAYFERQGDYYFIVESKSSGRREGTIGIYNLDPAKRCAEWGRWVIQAGSSAGLESAFLIYRTAFERLDLSMVYARTAVINEKVLSFHDSCHLPRVSLLPAALQLPSGATDAVEHQLTSAQWPAIQQQMEQKVARMARILMPGSSSGLRHPPAADLV